MKKRGFTLIELLAVIVILAIVTIVIVPIVSKVINEAKEKAAIESFKGYMDAVEKTILEDSLNIPSELPEKDSNGCYNLNDLDLKIKVKGERPAIDDDDDDLCVQNGKIISISEIVINRYRLEYKNGKILINGKITTKQPDSVKIINKDKLIYVGKTLQLDATVDPSDAKAKLTYISSDESKATVSKNGLVTGISKGEVTITVTTQNHKTDSIKLDVTSELKSIAIINEENTVGKNKTLQLTTSAEPEGATSTLTWESSDDSVATVSKNGLVTGKKEGNVVITVTTENGKTDTKLLKVMKNASEAVVTITEDPDEQTWAQSKTITINGIAYNSKLQYKRVNTDTNWVNYSEPFSINQNMTIIARLYNETDNEESATASYNVTKIDTTPPTCSLKMTASGVTWNTKTDDNLNAFGLHSGSSDSGNRYNGKNLLSLQLSNNIYTYRGVVVDKAGNETTCKLYSERHDNITVKKLTCSCYIGYSLSSPNGYLACNKQTTDWYISSESLCTSSDSLSCSSTAHDGDYVYYCDKITPEPTCPSGYTKFDDNYCYKID